MKNLSLLIMLGLLLPACASLSSSTDQSPNLFPACQIVDKRSGVSRCGYIDKTGKMKIKTIYEEAKSFSNGLAAVKMIGSWGYINEAGDLVIPLQFSDAGDFSGNVAPTKPLLGPRVLSTGSGLIDRTGNKITDPIFKHIERFSEGLAPAVTTPVGYKPKFGYIDETGKVVIDGNYDFASHFSDGLAFVCSIEEISFKETKTICNYIDKKGNTAIAMNAVFHLDTLLSQAPFVLYSRFGYSDFSEGLAAVCIPSASQEYDIKAAKCGYIDKSGKFIIETKPAVGGRFSEDLAPIYFVDSGYPLKWGYIDKKGNIVIQPQFAEAYPFSQGIARVRIYDSIYHEAYINKKGEIIWDSIASFRNSSSMEQKSLTDALQQVLEENEKMKQQEVLSEQRNTDRADDMESKPLPSSGIPTGTLNEINQQIERRQRGER